MRVGDESDGPAAAAGNGTGGSGAVANVAAATSGGVVVQAGRDVNLRTGEPVRTRYRHQVLRIAPRELIGRGSELADLAAFCSEESADGWFRWLKAAAWAGKSALLSWFAVNPPPGVRVVSFFVTAQLADQADRVAFVENVLEQLLTLLGEQMPPFLTPATREAHLLGLLEDAASLCAERGERLVLVVDGLDEDRGVGTGPDSHSIAALLPARPLKGLRVVVAGRPDPPVPDDVPEGHPLRDGGIVRELEVSPEARAVRAEMKRDLKRLLAGRPERDLLGLVVASGGGLTADDLATLTGTLAWEVREHLGTATGRSFTRRDNDLAPGTAPEVYLLAHGDLRVTAAEMLGAEAVSAYREQVHRWAAGYRDRGWPAETPEYLLRGYLFMLLTTADVGQATALCTDPVRHERLFAHTGDDRAALAQLAATLDRHVTGDAPDLLAVARLAVHRDHLTDRTTRVPPDVPRLWVRMGRANRAVSFALAVTDDHRQSSMLVSVVDALVDEGLHDQAAETAALIPTASRRGTTLVSLARTLTATGRHGQAADLLDQAVTTALSTDDPDHRSLVLVAVVDALVDTGRPDRAAETAALIPTPARRGTALVHVAGALTATGRRDQAADLLDQVVTTALALDDPRRQNPLLADAVGALFHSGLHDRAIRTAATITNPFRQGEVLTSVVRSLIRARLHDRAVEAARAVADPGWKGAALVSVIESLAAEGSHGRVQDLLEEVTGAVRAMPNPYQRNTAFVSMARALATAHHDDREDRPERAALAPTDHAWSGSSLASVVTTLTRAGHHDRAAETARSITDPAARRAALVSVADALVEAEQHDEAEYAVVSATDRYRRNAALASAAKALADAGLPERALATGRSIVGRPETAPVVASLVEAGMFDQAVEVAVDAGDSSVLASVGRSLVEADRCALAVEVARLITDDDQRDLLLTAVAESLVEAGLPHLALDTAARSITDAYRRVLALVPIVKAFAEDGARDRVDEVADQAVGAARSITDAYRRSWALRVVVGVLAVNGRSRRAEVLVHEIVDASDAIGDLDLRCLALESAAGTLVDVGLHAPAIEVARSIADPERRAAELVALAEALHESGFRDRAEDLVDEAVQVAHTATDPFQDGRALMTLAEVLARAGHPVRAVAVVGLITDPDRRAWALVSVAKGAVEARLLDRAEELADEVVLAARSILDPYRRSSALASAAGVLRALGRHDEAERLVDEVLRPTRSAIDPDLRGSELVAAVEALAEGGLHDLAAEAVARITRRHQRASALAAVARELAKAGRHDRAVETASLIVDPQRRSWSLLSVVEALVEAGRHDQAIALARSIPWPHQRGLAIAGLAERLVATDREDRVEGLVEELVKAADETTGPDHQALLLAAASKAMAVIGRHDRAADLLDRSGVAMRGVHDRYDRNSVLAAMATALAAAGHDDRTGKTVESITDPDQRAAALAAVAETLATCGRHGPALEVIDAMVDPNQRSRTTMRLARLARDTAPRDAGRLAALALRTAHWSTATTDLRHVSLPTVLAMIDEVTALTRMGTGSPADAEPPDAPSGQYALFE